jgi:hypothetical protein
MDFKKASDALFAQVEHADLAKAIGVSVALIRQARLQPKANAHRTPPEGWERAIIRLAEERVIHYQRLAMRLKKNLPK